MRSTTLLLPLSLALAGCSIATTATPSADAGFTLTGRVHGGQQPIVGAHVYLMAANTTGYGGSGIAPSSSNASLSLLSSATGQSDSIGNYVLTGSDGSFSIAGDYTCAAGQQVYLYALGGNPGAGTNSASGLMAALAGCPGPSTYIWINEVSTVAAAYAIAGFASDATHVSSSGTALAKIGIANAFANAANLVSTSTGGALVTTPAGNGAVPQTTLNSLANILAACVNSTGPGSSSCSTLFANAPSLTGSPTLPGDTAGAAINIAHNSAANIAALYGIPAPAVAFAPVLSTQPNDWTISINYTGGGLFGPRSIAIDGAGNVWIPNGGSNSVTEFSPTGFLLSGAGGFTGGGMYGPNSIAIDTAGDAWIGNFSNAVTKLGPKGASLFGATGETFFGLSGYGGVAIDGAGDAWFANDISRGGISEMSNSGVLLSPPYVGVSQPGSYFNGINFPEGIAIDGSGNIWIPSNNAGSVFVGSNSGTLLNSFTGGGLYNPKAAAIDSSGNAWIANNSGDSITEISHAGTFLTGTNGLSGGGLMVPSSVAIDGAGSAWVANSYGITEISHTGSFISGSNGFVATDLYFPEGIAIDGSGNVWMANGENYHGVYSATVFIGAATPVITPIAAGLPLTPTSDGTSNLGTRP